MVVLLILGILSSLFAFLTKYRESKYGLELSFIIIFIFLSIRFNFGNDYTSYYKDFIEITNNYKIDLNYGTYQRTIEPGWIILCWLFKPLGFYSLIAFHSLLFCIAYYHLFKKYISENYYWLSLLIFIFNPVFLLIQLSAIRQSLAVAFVIVSYQYVLKRKFVPFILIVISASLFHESALIFIPSYLLGSSKLRINNFTIAFSCLLFLLLTIYGKQIYPILGEFIVSNFEKYNEYVIDEKIDYGSGLGLLYNIILFIFTLYIGKKQKDNHLLFFYLSIINFIFIPIILIINNAERLNYYFQPAILITIPIILNYIKIIPLRRLLIFIVIAFALRSYYSFINNALWHDAYKSYKTIFSLI